MKGQADIIYLLGSGFAVTIALVMLLVFWHSFSTSAPWQTLVVAKSAVAANATTSANTAIFNIGNALAIIWILSFIGSVVATFFIDSSPVFAVVGIILMPIEIFLSMLFHDYFFVLAQNSFLAPVIALIPFVSNFYTVLPVIAMVFIFVSVVFTFAKPR